MWLKNSTTLYLNPFLFLLFSYADHVNPQSGLWDSEQKAFLYSALIPQGSL